MFNWVLRPVLSLFASKFLYPEVIHPTLMKVWKRKEWKKTRDVARDVVRFYNLPVNDGLTDEQKRTLALEMVKTKLEALGIEMSDSKIDLAIIGAVNAEKAVG
jgi:hypothetical protein